MMTILGCLIALFLAGTFGMAAISHVAYYRSTCRSPFRGTAGFLAFLLYSGLVLSLIVVVCAILDATPKYRRVSPGDAYGTYRIDRSFYSGKNADWQYEHYKFVITPENRLILTEVDDAGIAHEYIGKVIWRDTETRRALWSAKLNTPHHLNVKSPALYRSYFSYYYVIRSEKYGNMFFRQESDYPLYEFAFTVLGFPIIWYLRRHKQRTSATKE